METRYKRGWLDRSQRHEDQPANSSRTVSDGFGLASESAVYYASLSEGFAHWRPTSKSALLISFCVFALKDSRTILFLRQTE
jgi:hypothetical protein